METERKKSRIVIRVIIILFALVAVYLIGFVIAVQFGPALKPPVSTVLEFVYWPLIKCDQDNIKPFSTVIRLLKFR
jgi:hypothetical protein